MCTVNVVFSIKLLVPVIHAGDNGKTPLLNLNAILVGVVECVMLNGQADRFVTARHQLRLQTHPLAELREE